jgi:hypothetical protein
MELGLIRLVTASAADWFRYSELIATPNATVNGTTGMRADDPSVVPRATVEHRVGRERD